MQHNASVWLIDNDEDIIDLFQRAFQKQTLLCPIKAFSDVGTLLSQMHRFHQLPNLLLIDYYMSEITGLQLIESLRSHPLTQAIKLVLFSRHLTEDVVRQAQALGVFKIAEKPFTLTEWREFARSICLSAS